MEIEAILSYQLRFFKNTFNQFEQINDDPMLEPGSYGSFERYVSFVCGSNFNFIIYLQFFYFSIFYVPKFYFKDI